MEQTLGKRIAANRKRLGMTQDQLAEKLGVTAQAVSKWENDQSCPDISILPKLAEIFGISTDELLGCRPDTGIIHEAEVVEEDSKAGDFCGTKGHWNFSWDNSKKDAIGLAVLVLTVGILYLLSQLLVWHLSFWDILWPTALLVFGLFGLFPKFSFFHLGCALVGGYFLARKLIPMPFAVDGGVIFAVIVLLFGISLLIDALRKSRKPGFHVTYTDKDGKTHHGRTSNSYETGDCSFDFSASFGEIHQLITLPLLRSGEISTSFGEFTVDLSGVEAIADGCAISTNCSFGQLTLLIPRRYCAKPASSTAFASFTVEGQSEECPAGSIALDINVSFGEVKVIYI